MPDRRFPRIHRPACDDDALATGIVLAIFALGVLTLLVLKQERNAFVILIAAAALSGRSLVLHSPRLSPTVAGLILGLGTSLVVTSLVNGPPLSSYWPAFFLWLAAATIPVTVAHRRSLGTWRKGFRSWVAIHLREIAVVTGLTLVAVFLRVINLSQLPWPFSGDEARFFLQGLEVKEGHLSNMFVSGYQGNPNAHFFALRGLMAIFGESILATRLYGVILGALLVPVTYLMLRYLFNRSVALIGASFVIAYHFALHYSRQNMNNIADAVVLSLVLVFLWRSLTYRKASDYLLTGMLSGLGLYVVVESRVAVPIVALACLIAFLQRSGSRFEQLRGIAFLVGGFLLVAGPIALFWYSHPEEFLNRVDDVGVFQSGWLERESEARDTSQASLLWTQVKHNFGAFGYYRDASPFYGAPSSLVDRAALPFFLLGAALALSHLRQLRYQLLLLSFAVIVIGGGVLTVGSPASQRLIGTIPVVVALVAVGVDASARYFARIIRHEQQALAYAVVIVLVLVGYNAYSYFGPYARGDSFSDFNTRIATRGSEFLRSVPPGTPVFWYGAPAVPGSHPSVVYGTRNLPFFEVFEDGSILTTSSPKAGSAAFLFLNDRERERDAVMAACPGGQLETVFYRARDFMYWTYRSLPETNCALVVTSSSGEGTSRSAKA